MPTPDGPLTAAIDALKAQPYPWSLPGYSILLTDAAMRTTIGTTYGFGTNVIIGLSPAAAATLTGLPIYTDGSTAAWAARPAIFVHPSQMSLLGQAISTSDSGGTVMVPYTNAFGRFDRVVWKWQCDVQLDIPVAYTPATLGKWDQQVVTYTGDGTAGRLIPTTFALDTGVVAIWIFPQTTDQPAFRHNAMSGTTMSTQPITTLGGIMAFQSGGFTVTDDALHSTFVNVLNRVYTALVFRDSTSNNSYMRAGSYHGLAAINTTGTFTVGSTIAIIGGITSNDIGRTITVAGVNGYVILDVLAASNIVLSDPSVNGGVQSVVSAVTDRFIQGGITRALSQLWIFGVSGSAVFGSDDFAVGNSVQFAIAATSVTGKITHLSSVGNALYFDVGTDGYVNAGSTTYYWLGFTIPVGDPIRALFATYVATGTGAVVTVPLGFTPTFATARQFITGTPSSVWRSPTHVGTASTQFDLTPVASGGIQAFNASSLDLGTTVLPNGNTAYGFALAGTGSVTVVNPTQPQQPFAPPYPNSYARPGAYVPTGVMRSVPGVNLTGGIGPAGPIGGATGSTGAASGSNDLAGGAGVIGGGFSPCGCGPTE